MSDPGRRDENDIKYAKIWKAMEHCVNVCILGTFRSVNEMLCGLNWVVVHERCRHIIEKHMKAMNIDDPHEFDKAVCWEAVSTGKDRDPMWRCICAFFFAAAMEVDKVKRLNGEKFKKAGIVESDDRDKKIWDILNDLRNSHGETHTKVEEMLKRLGGHGSQAQQNQHVTNVNNHIHNTNQGYMAIPAQNLDEFIKKIVNELRPSGSKSPFNPSYKPPSDSSGNVYDREPLGQRFR